MTYGTGLEGPPPLEIAPAPREAEGWGAAPSPGKARAWGEWGESAEWAEVDLREIALTKEIARGSSSVVYRGVYRKQSVAGGCSAVRRDGREYEWDGQRRRIITARSAGEKGSLAFFSRPSPLITIPSTPPPPTLLPSCVYRSEVKVVDLGSDDGSSLHEVQERRDDRPSSPNLLFFFPCPPPLTRPSQSLTCTSPCSPPQSITSLPPKTHLPVSGSPHLPQVIGAHIPLLSPEAHPSPSPRPSGQQRVDSRLRGEQACVVSALIGTGVTLKDYLARTAREKRKLPLHMLVDLAMQLAKSLAFLHSLRVVHGDVCPDHVLLDSSLRLHLAGFSCASIEGDLAHSHAGRGEERGNPNYMAPEVLNSLPYDRQADVFSFGMCLWAMLSCELPFPKCDYNEISDLLQQGVRPILPPKCPPDLAHVLRCCWEGDPAARPSMPQVTALLRSVNVFTTHHQDGAPTVAPRGASVGAPRDAHATRGEAAVQHARSDDQVQRGGAKPSLLSSLGSSLGRFSFTRGRAGGSKDMRQQLDSPHSPSSEPTATSPHLNAPTPPPTPPLPPPLPLVPTSLLPNDSPSPLPHALPSHAIHPASLPSPPSSPLHSSLPPPSPHPSPPSRSSHPSPSPSSFPPSSPSAAATASPSVSAAAATGAAAISTGGGVRLRGYTTAGQVAGASPAAAAAAAATATANPEANPEASAGSSPEASTGASTGCVGWEAQSAADSISPVGSARSTGWEAGGITAPGNASPAGSMGSMGSMRSVGWEGELLSPAWSGEAGQAWVGERPVWEIKLRNVVLKKEIAKGSSGTVYKGKYKDCPVAVRVVPWSEVEGEMSEGEQWEQRRAKFLREVTIWRRLKHPNIVKHPQLPSNPTSTVSTASSSTASTNNGRDDKKDKEKGADLRFKGHAFCVPGVSAFHGRGARRHSFVKLLTTPSTLLVPPLLLAPSAPRPCGPLFSASLAYLHSMGVVHGDICPENLLLDGKRRLKIARFGAARVESSHPVSTATGSCRRTLSYSAPEVIPLPHPLPPLLPMDRTPLRSSALAAVFFSSSELCSSPPLSIPPLSPHHAPLGPLLPALRPLSPSSPSHPTPSQVLFSQPYDRSADVHSFGICLWELYAREAPFPNLDFGEVADAVKEVRDAMHIAILSPIAFHEASGLSVLSVRPPFPLPPRPPILQGARPIISPKCPPDLANVMRCCWEGLPTARPPMPQVLAMLKKVNVFAGK
ncbi:unnamed protein product [Closterium sp. Naga37s-1]|nr:unnamed protein product [Closterium sp. Naga37s-1]